MDRLRVPSFPFPPQVCLHHLSLWKNAVTTTQTHTSAQEEAFAVVVLAVPVVKGGWVCLKLPVGGSKAKRQILQWAVALSNGGMFDKLADPPESGCAHHAYTSSSPWGDFGLPADKDAWRYRFLASMLDGDYLQTAPSSAEAGFFFTDAAQRNDASSFFSTLQQTRDLVRFDDLTRAGSRSSLYHNRIISFISRCDRTLHHTKEREILLLKII